MQNTNITNKIIVKLKKLSPHRQSELLKVIDSWLVSDNENSEITNDHESENHDHSGLAAYSNDNRTYSRKKIILEVAFDIEGKLYKEMTKNVSGGGLFIKTRRHKQFQIGHNVSLVFTLPGTVKPIKIDGNIIRIDKDGVAVKFNSDATYKSVLIESELSSISESDS